MFFKTHQLQVHHQSPYVIDNKLVADLYSVFLQSLVATAIPSYFEFFRRVATVTFITYKFH